MIEKESEDKKKVLCSRHVVNRYAAGVAGGEVLVRQLTSPQQDWGMGALLKVIHRGWLCKNLTVRPPAHCTVLLNAHY